MKQTLEATLNEQNSLNNKPKITQVELGIKKEEISHIVQSLSTILASTYVLYMKTQGFHWNVVGPNFYSLHKLSEEHYQEMAEAIDTLAERIRALGHIAPASYSWYEKLSIIKDVPEVKDGKSQLQDLVADHEAMSSLLKDGFDLAEKARDHGTADLFVGRMRAHEKAAWMLRAVLG
jgi:starvation-inducible DNA-binding protein